MPVNQSEVKFFEQLQREQQGALLKPLKDLSINEYRKIAKTFSKYAGEPEPVHYQDTTILSRDEFPIQVRIYNDDLDQTLPVLIFLPGCGYINNLFETNAIICSRIAKYSGVRVAVVNYRLAPEFSLPTAIYDSYDVVRYIATHHEEFNIDPGKVLLCGLSSGANAAAVVTNLARQDRSFKICRQILVSGFYDMNRTFHDFDKYEQEEKLLTSEAIDYTYNMICPNAEDRSKPILSPYYEKDLSGLPPTTIIVGEYDGVRNDSEAYYKRLKQAKNNVEKIVMPGQTHNTIALRTVMTDGEDPAKVIAKVVTKV